MSWPEIKSLLDDPYVSADTKELLIATYVHQLDLFQEVPDEVRQYAERFDMSGGDFVAGQWVSSDQVVEAARRESEEAGYGGRQVAGQVAGNESALGGLVAPGVGGVGVERSDELFDLARPALKVFEVFLPVDAEVPSDSRSVHSPVDFADVEVRFDEQRGIDFRKVLGEAERLGVAFGVLDGLRSAVQGQLNSLYQSWSGAAANASYEHFTGEIDPHVGELLPFLQGGSRVVVDAVGRVFEACRLKAEQVLGLYQETVGAATPEIAAKVVKLARGDFGSQDEVLEVAAWVDAECGSNLEERIRADDCGLNEGNKSYTVSQCKKWVRESFNVELYGDGGAMGLYLRFEQICDDTVEAVDQAWGVVNDYFAGYVNEFPQAGGVAPPAGGAGTGGGSGSVPASLPPEVPVPPPGGASASGGGGTGAPEDVPSELPPDQNVTLPTSPSVLTGEPETVSMLDPASRSSTTITVGDLEISVTSPDGQGHVTVTVGDGTGEPKTYQLDFGTGMPEAAVPLPGQQPGTNMPLVDPGGSTIQAGQDGKCVIKDGPLAITAEHPPSMPDTLPNTPPDTLRVTVDSGTGASTTYTLDFSDPANPIQVTTPQGQFANGSNAGGFDGTFDGGPAGSAGAPKPEYVATPPDASIPGEASLASAQDQPASPVHPPGQPGAVGGTGSPMLGGMGTGSGTQDQERGPGRFGMAGDLFADDFDTDERLSTGGSTFRITGSLDDDRDLSDTPWYGRRPDAAR